MSWPVWSFFIGMVTGSACTTWGIWLERHRWTKRMLRYLDASLDNRRPDAHPDAARWSPDDQQ